MTHSICASGANDELTHVQHLWRMLLAPDSDPETKLRELFELETAEFDLDYAFLARIDVENDIERFEIVHGSHEMFQPGTTVPLSETYCRKAIATPEGTLAVSDALAEGWEHDPAYDRFRLGSYLGTTVSVADELYGTLCFVAHDTRDDPIRDEEKALVEMYSQWIEYILTLWDEPQDRESGFDSIERPTVSSEDIDRMMDILSSRDRRVILKELLGTTPEVGITALERRIDRENIRIRLHHNHLPKLANAGYIQCNGDSGTISRGPTFATIEPLVQLLAEYNTTTPE